MEEIYVNVDSVKQIQHSKASQNQSGSRRFHGAVVLCLVLLSVFLLIGLISLCVYYHNSVRDADDKFSTIKTNLTELLQGSQIKLSSLTEERNKLKTNLTEMTEERDQLKTNLNEITEEHNRLQCLCKQNKTCPTGWIKLCSSCYFLSTESGSWTTGREDCRNRGADLVVIDSIEEQTFLSKLINKDTWIGLNDRDKEETWKWVDGTPLTVTYWASKEPNNGNGDRNVGEEDCVEVLGGQSSNWNDYSCEASRQWICEKPAQP